MKICAALLLLFLHAASLDAQSERHVRAAASVEEYRPAGDRRVWSFFSIDKTFGTLVSTMTGPVSVEGTEGWAINENLIIDYTQVRGDRVVRQSREHFVNSQGRYLGDRMKLHVGDQVEEFELSRKGNLLQGYYTRSGRKVEQSVEAGERLFAWDNDYVDQLELLLAMRDIKVGDRIVDSIFQPQSMMKARVSGTVEDYFFQEVYANSFDSVFLIRLQEPTQADLFFTADRRLVKTDLPLQKIRIYQDLVEQVEVATTPVQKKTSQFSLVRLIAMSPHYAAYVVFSLVTLLMFMKGGYKWADSWLAYIIGGVLFLVTLVTQIPLQKLIITSWLVPAVSRGESLYAWAVLPPIVAGLVQETLKLGALFIVVRWRGMKSYRYSVIGAFCGAGFALAEACYHAGLTIVPLFTLSLLGKIFFIVYHVASGALLGHAMSRGIDNLVRTIAVLILVDSVLRYLPVYVQQGDVTIGAMHFIFAFAVVIFLGFALLRLRRSPKSRPG